MITKPHAAFGFLLISQTFADGEQYLAEVSATPSKVHFWVKGRFKNRNVATNELMEDFVPGTLLALSDYVPGIFEHTTEGETVLYCISMAVNRGHLPEFTKLAIPAGESVSLPIGTKLFHCEGEMVVNGNMVDKPTQLTSKTSALAITASTDCYGMVFK